MTGSLCGYRRPAPPAPSSLSLLILLDDLLGDAAATGDREAVLSCPCPDRLTIQTRRVGCRAAAVSAGPAAFIGPARRADEGLQCLLQLGPVLLPQVDLIGAPRVSERD